MRNRSFPPGTVIPELAYADVAAASAWLCEVFGFRERLRIGTHRAQLVFNEASVVAVEGGTGNEDASHGVPADQLFGERQYTAVDIGGHYWTFSQTIADVDPASWGGVLPEP